MQLPKTVQLDRTNESNLIREVRRRSHRTQRWRLLVSCTLDLLLGEGDMHRVIEYIRRAPDGFFLYLTHTYSRNDTRHNYYNLRCDQLFLSFEPFVDCLQSRELRAMRTRVFHHIQRWH